MLGSKDTRRGAHVPRATEWNNLNNALSNIRVGDNDYNPPGIDKYGMELPYDSFFFPHIAQIEVNGTDAIIGPDREESYYPYTDSIPVQKTVMTMQFELIDGFYTFLGNVDTDTSSSTVLFTYPGVIEPEKPADNADAAVVGYIWTLTPLVTSVLFSDDESIMYVEITWEADSDFDSDIQSDLYTEDAGDTPASWAPQSGNGASGTLLETLINDYLDGETEPNISIFPDQNEEILDQSIKIPIAAYNWDIDELRIERVVQLYFGGGAPGTAAQTVQSAGTIFEHPFKGEIVSASTVSIGKNRASAGYKFKDSITFTDPDSDVPIAIEFDAEEQIALDDDFLYDYYVYYDCYKYTATEWAYTLRKSKVWPPEDDVETGDAPPAGNILKLIGYAQSTDYGTPEEPNETYIWGQEMFDCPNEQPANIRGEFEPYYAESGSVIIAAGTVETFAGDVQAISEQTVGLAGDTDVWVTAQSQVSAGAPNVTITGMHTGSYPGLYQSVSDSIKKFNYKIGSIASGIYIPSHKGRLQIDATLLQPQVSADYTGTTNVPRMLIVHDDQVATVGNPLNDTLIDFKTFNPTIRGGNVQQMLEGSKINMYGKTDDSSLTTVEVSSTNGTTWGAGSITATSNNIGYEFDTGLMQDLEELSGTSMTIEAGDEIKISVTGNTAKIIGKKIEADEKWLSTQVTGQGKKTIHKKPPVTSTGDSEHWTSFTCDDGAGTHTVYIDVNGHIWKVDDATSTGTEENYRYEHCSLPGIYNDVILTTQAESSVIKVDYEGTGVIECFEYIGTTTDTANDPSVLGTFTTCSACSTDTTIEYWSKCSDDSFAAYLTEGHTTKDYVYLCLSGQLVKSYHSGFAGSTETPTDPTVYEQCDNAAPASCSDLKGIPGSDSFSGTGCDSGTTSDDHFTWRWQDKGTDTSTSASITGASLRMSVTNPTTYRDIERQNYAVMTGDGTCSTSCSAISSGTNLSNGFIFFCKNTSDGSIQRLQYDYYTNQLTDEDSNVLATSPPSALKFVRSGSTITSYYNTGGGFTASPHTKSSSADLRFELLVYGRSPSDVTTISFDNFDVIDGSSADIYIDIEGNSCS